MFLLRVMGIEMSDDASKTLGGGVRAWLGTSGFLLMMFGGYFIYEHNNLYVGIPMIAGGLPLFILPWAWDRFMAPLWARDREVSAWKSVPVTESNLEAYIRSSPLVRKLDDQIAQNEQLPIKPDKTMALPEQESAQFFGVTDIATVDMLLEENQEAVLRISSYSFTDNEYILRGASVGRLFDILGIQLGEDSLRKLNMLWQLKHITEHGMQNRLSAYKEFTKNRKTKVRVPLVPDFNLMSIEEGLSLVREQCRRSTFANSLPRGGLLDSESLAYFEHLKNKIALYGSLRGRKERSLVGRRPNQFPPSPLSPGVQNPRFEAGKLIIDSQLFHNDNKGNLGATNVTYERLYVLRPDLLRAIEQLNELK
jgi:hypothetical protein